MSNIFAPLVRPFGTLPVELGSGPVVGGTEYHHLWIDSQGSLFVSNAAIHHYGAAVPFDTHGRVVISSAPVVRWDQDIPFTASGAVAMLDGSQFSHWDQGLTFLESGHIATGDVAPAPEPPIWSHIPDKANYLYELPQDYDVSPYVSDAGAPITGYNLIGAPDFFTVDNAGVVTAGVGAADAAHLIEVEACNSVGCSSTTFTWDLSTGNVPTWGTIPDQQHRQDELPKTLDVKPYASSDSGPILTYSLVGPPAGISMVNGVVTVAAGTAVSSYLLTVRATNGVGAGDTTFTWTVLETLTGPQWSTIPNQINVTADLPQDYDVSPYVTSNAGGLRNWLLITPPAGFTIDQAGVVTASAGVVIAVHNIVAQVENDVGTASSSFQWTISADLLPPQWQTIPPTSTSEELLPAPYDVSSFASSNSGPLINWTLVAAPVGFTINSVNGVITAAAGIAPGPYSLVTRVTNDTGTTDSAPFDWEIELFYLPPQWEVIPDQSHGDDELPIDFDVSPYVTTNSGPLTGWALVAPPAGFTISAAGVVTVAFGTAPGAYNVTVSVDNDEGTGTSEAFAWTISSVLLSPQWSTIPDQTTREDNLPATLDATLYVTSNSGPLTGWELVSPPAGFTIDAVGLVTAAAGISPAGYSLQVRVTNNTGTASSNIFSWQIDSFYLPPVWDTIPDQSTEEQLLPVALDVEPYVTSNHGLLVNWSLVSPPSGFTINQNGVISVSAGRTVGDYEIIARVGNDSGTSDSAAFTWSILEEPLVPQWETIPNQQTREDILPQNLDVSQWVTSNAGSLTAWELVAPPTGFSINGAGLITVAAGTAVAVHPLTVRVSNDIGSSDSAQFTWEVQEELLPPQWQTVPGRSDRINVLPQPYAMSFYVTSNAGTLISWRLASSPPGFSINVSSGVITATAGAGLGDHSLRVGVTNSQGESLSNTFTWTILEELLPPQWQTIPPKTTAAEDLADTYDVSPYVTSNSGPLDTWSLLTPPAGFSINQSGVVTAATNVATGTIHPITVQVFNDEGGSSKAFNWTIDAPLVTGYLHEFNADLGGFTFTRASNATRERYDDPSVWDTVGVDAPVYGGCDYNGSIYVPTVGFTGLVLESVSTNYVQRSISHDNAYWGHTNATSSPPQLSVSAGFGSIYAGTPAIVLDDLLILSADAQKVSSDDIFLNGYAGGDNGATIPITTTYQRAEHSTTNPTQATRGPILAISTSGQAVNVTNIQVEVGGARNEASSRIISDSGSSTARAVGGAQRTLASMGLTPSVFNSHHAGQLKVYLDFTRAGPQQFIAGVLDPTFAEYAVLLDCSEVGDDFRILQQVNGNLAALTHAYVWTQGEFIDFRWKVTPTQRLKWWVNSVAAGTDAAAIPAYSTEPTLMKLGNVATFDVPGMRVHTLRLQEGEVSDVEILGWP